MSGECRAYANAPMLSSIRLSDRFPLPYGNSLSNSPKRRQCRPCPSKGKPRRVQCQKAWRKHRRTPLSSSHSRQKRKCNREPCRLAFPFLPPSALRVFLLPIRIVRKLACLSFHIHETETAGELFPADRIADIGRIVHFDHIANAHRPLFEFAKIMLASRAVNAIHHAEDSLKLSDFIPAAFRNLDFHATGSVSVVGRRRVSPATEGTGRVDDNRFHCCSVR